MPHKNQEDRNRYMREWKRRNSSKRYKNEINTIQKSFKSFIKYRIKSAVTIDKRRNQKPDLDIDYLMGLFEQQEGLCAISGYPMTHVVGDIYSVSMDRIDSSKGHIKGNIQLVCLIMQYAKNKFDDHLVKKFIQNIPGVQCVSA